MVAGFVGREFQATFAPHGVPTLNTDTSNLFAFPPMLPLDATRANVDGARVGLARVSLASVTANYSLLGLVGTSERDE